MTYTLRKNLAHFGTILYRFSFIGLLCVFGLLVSEVLVVLIMLFLLMIAMATLFIAFLDEGFRNAFNVYGSFGEIIAEAGKYLPAVVAISLTLLVIGSLCLLPDYKNKATRTRLIISLIMAIMFIIILIIALNGGGSNA